jgi:hypothetical protein
LTADAAAVLLSDEVRIEKEYWFLFCLPHDEQDLKVSFRLQMLPLRHPQREFDLPVAALVETVAVTGAEEMNHLLLLLLLLLLMSLLLDSLER